MSESLREKHDSTPLFGGNAPLVESYYEAFLSDPESVPANWREYFSTLVKGDGADTPHAPIRAELIRRAGLRGRTAAAPPASPELLDKQAAVLAIIERYRLLGHKHARIDPLGLTDAEHQPDLEPGHYGLGEQDMDTLFSTGNLHGSGPMKLRDILAMVRAVYSGPVGAEFAHISSTAERRWLQELFESTGASEQLSPEEKIHLLQRLTAAEGMERYLHTRYVGQKRFSLEGGESLIPILDDLINQAGVHGVQDIVVGMAHRGRINVLINVVGKSPAELFQQFDADFDPKRSNRSGDVKYHLGYSCDIRTPGGDVHVALAFNPSHLEIVNPVVEGSVRARQERRGDTRGQAVLPVLIHGDSAFAGQGVVMETLQLSQARGFSTGGTVHIVCNNQIGFTTSDPRDTRSTPYCTDVAKMVEAPVFHVNGDDPHALILVTRIALQYRMKFGKDVVIDLVCYRRHGHNEADEPAATQPLMYRKIREHPPVRELYAQRLAQEGVVSEQQAAEMFEEYRGGLDEGRTVWRSTLGMIGNKFTADWSRFHDADITETVASGVAVERIAELAERLGELPEGLRVHPRVKRIVDGRLRMAAGKKPLDWGFAETLAYATLVTEGSPVRLVGQDSGRGTFFHRHAVLHGQEGGDCYVPLQHLQPQQARFNVVDSLLSEEAVLGFEYGYSSAEPAALVIWEAQFGDFCNGAQVVIDQFISSGEAKWDRFCGLVLFLPHGYEGQGPEHSSARLERFLQLCAENNMQVCVPSTPAQIFHLLRRQVMASFRKPLVVMTPKSLLRHKLAVSRLEDLAEGGFEWLLGEQDALDPGAVERVVFCSGKVYYDLLSARREQGREDVAIVRLEQLYPFPSEQYAAQLELYHGASEIVWCQEEPQNQGAWYQIRHRLQEPLRPQHALVYAGRPHAAAPATGHYNLHALQQTALVEEALGGGAQGAVSEAEAVRKKA